MRSVMKNPPTTLLVAATIAITPSTVAKVLFFSPTRTIAPTTAIASSALVRDISGVCSKGETWRMTSNPMKAASMNTNSASIKLDPMANSSSYFLFPLLCSERGQLEKLSYARVNHLSFVGNQRLADDLILLVQL